MRAVEEPACKRFSHKPPFAHKLRIMHFFLCTKEKSSKKEVCEPAVRPPRRAGYHPRKFRPHLTQEFSVQMGCHRGITNSPNRGFFPTECVRQKPSLITRPAPRTPYGHRRGLCVGAFVCVRNLFYIVGRWACSRRGSGARRSHAVGERGYVTLKSSP